MLETVDSFEKSRKKGDSMKRRDFLARTMAAPALASATIGVSAAAAEQAPGKGQQIYELRAYRLKDQQSQGLLDGYLADAAIPGLNRLGIEPVGVFVEKEPAEAPTVFTLIPFSSADAVAAVASDLNADAQYQQAGAAYLQVTKDNPAFVRIDSWLMLAFAGLPQMNLPPYCRAKSPRLFELRTYESFSETKALKKVDMFNNGEIECMLEVGLAPIFYGQALIGPNLPHLTYMTSAEDEASHKEHWAAFGKHPTWEKLKTDPQYADTVSKITKWILTPTAYSQI
jgi:hypothetical protein